MPLSERAFGSAGGQPVCLGHIDCDNEPTGVLGCRSPRWLRKGH
jgi:hypothetical protein